MLQGKSLFNGALIFLAGTGYSANTILIKVNSKSVMIIDVGTPENVSRVISALNKHFPHAETIQLVVTHEHYDHVGGLANLSLARSCIIYASAETARVLKEGDSIYSVANLFGTHLNSVSVDEILKGNDILSTSLGPFIAIKTPGHTRGSICLYNKEHRILIAGDTVFPNGGFGRTDLPGGNMSLLKDSLLKLSQLKVDTLISGHGSIVLANGSNHIMMALNLIEML